MTSTGKALALVEEAAYSPAPTNGRVMTEHPHPADLVTSIDFGMTGNGADFRTAGWSHAEDNHTWGLWPRCALRVPVAPSATSMLVVFDVLPYLRRPFLAERQISVAVDGLVTCVKTISEKSLVALLVRPIPAQQFIEIEFAFPDAMISPDSSLSAETRPLALDFERAWVFRFNENWPARPLVENYAFVRHGGLPIADEIQRLLTMTPGEVLERFESLGHSCDFGLAQRELGLEPLGLLRFGGTSTRDAFIGLMSGFEGIGERDAVVPYVPEGGGEYWVHETRYGLHYHTFVPPGQAAPDQIIARELWRLPFLRRKFLEDIALGEKIFILRRPEPMNDIDPIMIWAALNRNGPNTLLYLDAESRGPVGSVDKMGPRLLRGHLDGKLGDVAPNMATWISICANAYLINQLTT